VVRFPAPALPSRSSRSSSLPLTSEWACRRARQRDAQGLSKRTLYDHHMIVRRHIIPDWGEEHLADLRAPDLEDRLYDLHISNRYRRTIAGTWNILLEAAERRRIIPDDETVPRKVWTNQDNKKEPKAAWLMFAVLLSTKSSPARVGFYAATSGIKRWESRCLEICARRYHSGTSTMLMESGTS
jgi:hypothetical protein